MGFALLCCSGGGRGYIPPKCGDHRILTHRHTVANLIGKSDSVVMKTLCIFFAGQHGHSDFWMFLATLNISGHSVTVILTGMAPLSCEVLWLPLRGVGTHPMYSSVKWCQWEKTTFSKKVLCSCQ